MRTQSDRDDDLAIGREFERKEALIDRLRSALEQSIVALDDWLHIHASEHCDAQRLSEAEHRVSEYGTLSYITRVQEFNRAAVADKRYMPPK